jgi:para-nitrobenzyl esterase
MRAISLIILVALAGCRTTRDARFAISTADNTTLRHTTAGNVVGGQGRYGALAWLGIPFAQPPVGPLRWRAPQPPKPWDGTRAALRFGHACPQAASPLMGEPGGDGDVGGDEDCLTLNVYAPPNAKKLPVMFWIHGGGNSIGSAATYDGGHLATAQNVVVVSTQYRLGPFGWLRHRALRAETKDKDEQSGNFGQLDLIRALEWVRDNAEAFGGDRDNVTIFGESAGGANVMSLLLAKRARGLFHRAIVESGGVRGTPTYVAESFADETPKGSVYSSNEVLVDLLVHDGKATGRQQVKDLIAKMSDTEIAAYLRSKTPREIVSVYKRMSGMLMMPLVFADGELLPSGEWVDALARADGWNQVPVMLGTNRDEFKLFMFADPRHTWKLFGVLPRYRDEAKYQALAEAVSRAWKATGVDAPAAAMLRSGAHDVYAYRFDWRGEPTLLGTDLKNMLGAAHGLEIPFVFGHFDLGPLSARLFNEENLADRTQLSQTMMGFWGTFARDGKPGGAWKQAPDMLVFDVPSEGGVRMSSQTEALEKIVTGIDTDPRLKTQRERCAVFHDLAFFRQAKEAETYELAARGTCDDYPYELYPWK